MRRTFANVKRDSVEIADNLIPKFEPMSSNKDKSKKSIKRGWISASPRPENSGDIFHGDNNLIMLNDHEFLLFSPDWEKPRSAKSDHVFFKYNSIGDEWTQLMDHHGGFSFAYDNKAHILYGLSLNNKDEMTVVDLSTKTVVYQYQLPIAKRVGVLTRPRLVNVDGTIHKVEARVAGHTRHAIWDKMEKMWIESDVPQWKQFGTIRGCSLIHVPSKGIILMIGGRGCGKEEQRPVYPASEKTEQNSQMIGIWRYHIASDRWEQIEGIEFNYYLSGCVLSSDERYVIIMGGYRFRNKKGPRKLWSWPSEYIHVLDIKHDDSYKLWRSPVESPIFEVGYTSFVARTGNLKQYNLLKSGWIRRVLGSTLETPMVIQDLIVKFGFVEMIHCVDTTDVYHKMRPLVDILRKKKRKKKKHKDAKRKKAKKKGKKKKGNSDSLHLYDEYRS